MKKILKRLLSTILCLGLLSVISVTAFAATETVKLGNLTYNFNKHDIGNGYGLGTCSFAQGYCVFPFSGGVGAVASEIPDQIEGYPVICMRGTFKGDLNGEYKKLGQTPNIPKNVIDMGDTFYNQQYGNLPMVIPDKVICMQRCYLNCRNMKSFPKLGASVENISDCFLGCLNASGTIEIPATVKELDNAFRECKKLSQIPDISHLTNVRKMNGAFSLCSSAGGGTDLPIGVPNDLSFMFSSCSLMTTPPSVIPKNVTITKNMFNQCENLSGEIDIYASISPDKKSDYAQMFSAAATAEGTRLVLNYTAENEGAIDDIIENKTLLSNIEKGRLLEGEPPVTEPLPEPEETPDTETTPNPDESNKGNMNLDDGTGNQDVIIEGIIEPINTLDVDIPIKLQFVIDENRNITYTQGAKVTSRSPAPLIVSCKSVTVPAGAPLLVADNAFTNWDNLSVRETHKNIAVSINNKNLSTPNVILGNLSSGYSQDVSLPINLSVLYGKQWVNSKQMIFDYAMNMEISLSNE